jgi:prevent-host-death family protein
MEFIDTDHFGDYSHSVGRSQGFEAEMQTIQASDFKARCLALMDDVAATGEVLVVTKNGKPIAELRPYSGGKADSPFGLHRDLRVIGDIVAPIAADEWQALE